MNSKLKIILWGVSGDATPEQKEQLNALGSPLTVLVGGNKVASELSGAHLIIAHDGLPNSYSKPNNVWLIYAGGSKTDTQPSDPNRSGTISWSTFIENVRNFHSHIKGKSEISKDDLGVLYAIDPKLEKLLGPFANANPFEASGKANEDLKRAKVELQTYVEKRTKKQNRAR
jgi:hypothetical protein